MPDASDDSGAAVVDRQSIAILVDNHRAFLSYLERRVGSRAVAEDILQDAFVRHLERAPALSDDALVPWFYRVLRNATIDRWRKLGTADRALETFAREVEDAVEPEGEIRQEICACVGRLAGTLKAEYADALRNVDVDGMPVREFAARLGISTSNAGVRLFRARQALRKSVSRSCGTCAEHGCLDCSCGAGQPGV